MGGFDQFRWDQGLWDGTGTGATPSTGPAVFLGVIDAAKVFLGDVDALLSLGLLNANARQLGTMQAAAIRLGMIPIRTGA